MAVTAVELAGDIASDAHACGSGAGVRHGARDVGCARCAVVDCGGIGRLSPAARRIGVAEGEILDEAGEGHFGGSKNTEAMPAVISRLLEVIDRSLEVFSRTRTWPVDDVRMTVRQCSDKVRQKVNCAG